MQVPVVLFDLDGTLSDSQVGIAAAYRHALGTLGLTADDATVRQWIGPGLRQVMGALGVPEERVERAVGAYRAYYSTTGIYRCRLFEGVPAMLSALKGAGKRLGVATSKPTSLAEKVLQYLGIAPYFEMVAGATFDDARVTKGDVVAYALGQMGGPNPETVALVGDRSYDVFGAIENGVHPIGAAWGYGTADELVSSGAEVLVEDPLDLAELLITNHGIP